MHCSQHVQVKQELEQAWKQLHAELKDMQSLNSKFSGIKNLLRKGSIAAAASLLNPSKRAAGMS